MTRWVGFLGIVVFVGMTAGACGTESASGTAPEHRVAASERPTRPTPTPSPAPPPPTCPASGASITVGPIEAALGHRAVVVKLTNCRSTPINLNGYPDVAVLDAARRPMKVTVAHGISYMAIDPGPSRIHLNKGESALAAVSWSSTVEVAENKSSGTYLRLAHRAGEKPVVWPVDTDLGTTARITLTAWCLKFPK